MGTWIVGAIVVAIIGFAGYSVLKRRKNTAGCGGSCDGCHSCPGQHDIPTQ